MEKINIIYNEKSMSFSLSQQLLAVLSEKFGNIFAYHIKLQIDDCADFVLMKNGVFVCVRNNRHRKDILFCLHNG